MRNFQNQNSEPHIYVFFYLLTTYLVSLARNKQVQEMLTFLFLNVADGRTSPLRGSAGLNHF